MVGEQRPRDLELVVQECEVFSRLSCARGQSECGFGQRPGVIAQVRRPRLAQLMEKISVGSVERPCSALVVRFVSEHRHHEEVRRLLRLPCGLQGLVCLPSSINQPPQFCRSASPLL